MNSIQTPAYDIAVLGLGAMGSRMAANLLSAGHRIAVWNRSAEKADPLRAAGARVAATPADAAADAEFVIAMVRDDRASREIWLDPNTGALARLRPDAVAIESSTLSLGAIRALAEQFAAHGIAFLDAPVVGSRPQAEAAQLTMLVGGDTATVARATPALQSLSSRIMHAGPNGSGAAAKLMINAMFSVQLGALAELMGMLQAQGIEPAPAFDIFAATPVCSPAANIAGQSMLAGRFEAQFPIELVAKDLEYAVAAIDSAYPQAPIVRAAADAFSAAVREGHGGDNITGIFQRYRSTTPA